jgi:hypothetical protein
VDDDSTLKDDDISTEGGSGLAEGDDTDDTDGTDVDADDADSDSDTTDAG